MKKIYVLAFIPILFLLGIPIWGNKVTPYILGLPFFIFWICFSVILTAVTLSIIYKFDPVAKEEQE
ncbi:DUF3311 domain-containing protein [Ectobacillus panaciterrae]|uniref:DUF3311 domain-containing protein n=1 Tax=Ectobacillus panaciterrae TaxID=363872 RepID=UPI0004909189|nr:DUF3311 domain-containing protein [Ectobacillus panaciterrae]